ncbi:hypothetical protein Gotur_012998 [Gossypium turneri]
MAAAKEENRENRAMKLDTRKILLAHKCAARELMADSSFSSFIQLENVTAAWLANFNTAALAEVRKLVDNGDYAEATKAVVKFKSSDGAVSTAERVKSFQKDEDPSCRVFAYFFFTTRKSGVKLAGYIEPAWESYEWYKSASRIGMKSACYLVSYITFVLSMFSSEIQQPWIDGF